MIDKPSFEYVNKKVEEVDSKVGDTSTLLTTDKDTVVEAVNELFTSVSNGKQLVASAITDKGVSTQQDATFTQMATNIRAIQTGGTGITPVGTIDITENRVYDVTNYASANVNVPTGTDVEGTFDITENGIHNIATYEKVNVQVPIPDGYVKPSGSTTITENGTYNVSGLASVVVKVESSGGDGGFTNGKTFRVTIPTTITATGYTTLVPADADIKAHINDTTLQAAFYKTSVVSSGGALLGAIHTASAIAADNKYGITLRQTSASAQSPSSFTSGLRSGTASTGYMYITDKGEVQVYVYSSYRLHAGEYVVTVSW